MKHGPTSVVPVRRPARRMSASVAIGPVPTARASEPPKRAPDPGAKKAVPIQAVPPKRKAEPPKKRQGPLRVSAEEGTFRSTGDTGTFNPVLTGGMRERLLALSLAPRTFRQAEAYVSDWHPEEKVLLGGTPVEVVRGRVRSPERPLPRTPESRWNLTLAPTLDTPPGTYAADPRVHERFARFFNALLSEQVADGQETSREIRSGVSLVRDERAYLADRSMRIRVVPDTHWFGWDMVIGAAREAAAA